MLITIRHSISNICCLIFSTLITIKRSISNAVGYFTHVSCKSQGRLLSYSHLVLVNMCRLFFLFCQRDFHCYSFSFHRIQTDYSSGKLASLYPYRCGYRGVSSREKCCIGLSVGHLRGRLATVYELTFPSRITYVGDA